MIYTNYMFYDFETVARVGESAKKPEQAEPIQLVAWMVHPRRLEKIAGSEFRTYIQPPFPSTEMDQEVFSWHQKITGKPAQELLDLWYSAPEQKLVWAEFMSYIKKYHTGTKSKTIFTAPIRAGMNIIGYDNVIFDKLCERYGFVNKSNEQNVVMGNRALDLMHLLMPWFENDPEVNSLSLDNMREYFGIDKTNAHDAGKDVDDTIDIASRFLKFHRRTAERIQFKGAFAKKEEVNETKE